MLIYADTDVCRWHIAQLDLEISDEIIAGQPAVFHIPYPYDSNFKAKIDRALAICSTVIILVSELHANSTRFIVNNQHPRIKYFICGTIEGYPSNYWMDWFITTCDFYKSIDILNKLNPYNIKPKLFDILLGWKKPHRDVVYNYIVDNNLSDQVIMTYLTDKTKPIDQQGIWNVAIPANTFNTITQIKYLGISASLSQLLPVDVYNSTAYTVVCETNYDNHYSFYTEKIVKPILARRLFIVFSGQYYLRNLRKIGFQTFDGIVDETYDTIENHDDRFQMALEQMHKLINQPQDLILEKIKPILEHNYNLMIFKDWYKDFSREFQSALLDHTG